MKALTMDETTADVAIVGGGFAGGAWLDDGPLPPSPGKPRTGC